MTNAAEIKAARSYLIRTGVKTKAELSEYTDEEIVDMYYVCTEAGE